MYYYDVENDTFLVKGIHHIPQDCVFVSETEFKELTEQRNQGALLYAANGGVKATPVPPSVHHQWTGTEWVISETKKTELKRQAQDKTRTAINELRDQKSVSGVFVEQIGKWFDSDDKTRQKLLSLKTIMDLVGEMTVDWTAADNTEVSGFNKQMLTAVISSILEVDNKNHQVARMHKQAMLLVEDPESYDYSQGWAKTYEDYLTEKGNK